MQNLDQAAAQWTAGALVFVQAGDDVAIVRPAAFVFGTPGGLLWIEPAYADTAGAAGLALHEREGQIQAVGAGFELRTAAGELVTVLPYDPEAGDADLVDGALEWFAGWLQGEGRSWADERERVRGLLLGDQAPA